MRIVVVRPLAGVSMKIQRGKNEFLRPSVESADKLVFDFDITVDIGGITPNFLGKYAQGPKDARFVYLNSGTYAGQHSIWGRRAKISLMNISGDQLQKVISRNGLVLATQFEGVGSDGGPACASIKGIEWRVVAV